MFSFLVKPAQLKRADYEDILHAIRAPTNILLINTLPAMEQSVLIKGTMPFADEEATINSIIGEYAMDQTTLIVYGKHANDETAEKKCRQFQTLGFRNVFLYGGGLFEWLLLQDIFGDVNFPTMGKADNFLRYKAPSMISRVTYKTLKF